MQILIGLHIRPTKSLGWDAEICRNRGSLGNYYTQLILRTICTEPKWFHQADSSNKIIDCMTRQKAREEIGAKFLQIEA